MRCVKQLLPLLTASPLAGRAVSVLNPNFVGKIIPEDLSLRDPKHYGLLTGGSHVAYMTTFFMENLAARHPGRLSLAHVYPGIVMTNGAENGRLPGWFKFLWRWVLAPIFRPFAVPFMETGERMLFFTSPRFPARPSQDTGEAPETKENLKTAVSSDGVVGGGTYLVTWNGETIPTAKGYKKVREDGVPEKVWDHTMKVFEDIEAEGVFTGY
jgi:hypothetical protein